MSEISIESREVSWKVLDIPVYGTVTGPKSNGKSPGIVLVAGSGPTDRNWCSPLLPGANGSGKLLAEKLADNGFVTLRYDKLASGPHVMENLLKFAGKISMQSHLDELSGAVETLSKDGNVDADNMFVLANSEGSIHAVNYQLQTKKLRFKGLILTGAPGRSVGDVARSQLAAQGAGIPNVDAVLKKYDEAISEFILGKPITMDPLFPDLVKQLLYSLETPANLPFSRELWVYRLGDYIKRIREPIMVLIGKKDIQINWKVDGKILEESLSNHPHASFVYPENANHVLKHEEFPVEKLTAEYVSRQYNAENALLDENTESAILTWLGHLH